MNLKTKAKGKLIADGCADTSVADIENSFVEALRTAWMVPLVGFDDDLYKKSIPIGATVNIIDLRNGTLIA